MRATPPALVGRRFPRPALRRGGKEVRYRLIGFARRARKRVTYCFLKSKMIDFFTDIIFFHQFLLLNHKKIKA